MSLILVVEDDLNLRNNICEILETEGFKVESSGNGLDGFEKAKSILPDLILSDVMMPKLDGFEMLNLLQNEPATSTIPVIFLTAKVEEKDLRYGMNLGADDYIYKPFSIDELIASVKTRLKKKQNAEMKLDKIKEDIADKLPHELKTPLVPILGYAEMIETETDINSAREMAHLIVNSGDLLKNKIDKFLALKDLILLEKNKSKLFNGSEFITELNAEFMDNILLNISNSYFPRRRVILNNFSGSKVRIKKNHLERAFTELIENGLKFSELDQNVEVFCSVGDGQLDVSIKDYGRGMLDSEIYAINSFRKFGTESFREKGLGIGLEIVKKIAALYEAGFSIQSSKNNFTVSKLNLPLLIPD